jgi:hypothetical protein
MNDLDDLRTPKRWALAIAGAVAATFLIATPATLGSTGGVGAGGDPGAGDGGRGSGHTNVNEAKYERLWSKVPARQKRWAHSTSDCESGGDPDAIGGGGRYRGAFQFTRSTWNASPKTPGGDPIDYKYKTQAVVAVKLKKRDGAEHWPVCG